MEKITTLEGSPFHAGEREVQERLGVRDIEDWARKVVRPFLPEQHREFHTSLPFLVAAAMDDALSRLVGAMRSARAYLQRLRDGRALLRRDRHIVNPDWRALGVHRRRSGRSDRGRAVQRAGDGQPAVDPVDPLVRASDPRGRALPELLEHAELGFCWNERAESTNGAPGRASEHANANRLAASSGSSASAVAARIDTATRRCSSASSCFSVTSRYAPYCACRRARSGLFSGTDLLVIRCARSSAARAASR